MTPPSETRAGKLQDIAFAIMNTAESSDECADKVLVDRSLVGQLREALAASEPGEAVAVARVQRSFSAGLYATILPGAESRIRDGMPLYIEPPVSADHIWLRQAIYEFKYLGTRRDLPAQDRERWAALTAALDPQVKR